MYASLFFHASGTVIYVTCYSHRSFVSQQTLLHRCPTELPSPYKTKYRHFRSEGLAKGTSASYGFRHKSSFCDWQCTIPLCQVATYKHIFYLSENCCDVNSTWMLLHLESDWAVQYTSLSKICFSANGEKQQELWCKNADSKFLGISTNYTWNTTCGKSK